MPHTWSASSPASARPASAPVPSAAGRATTRPERRGLRDVARDRLIDLVGFEPAVAAAEREQRPAGKGGLGPGAPADEELVGAARLARLQTDLAPGGRADKH